MEKQSKDGTFYKKIGPDQWEMVTRKAKDGTVYKKVDKDQWAPLDSPKMRPAKPNDERVISAGSKPGGGFLQGAVDALPAAGGMIGGVVGTGLGPAGTFGGAVLGAGLGKGLEGMIESALYDEEPLRSPTMSGTSKALRQQSGEAATEATFAGLGGLIRPAAKALGRGKDTVLRSVREFDAPSRPDVSDVIESSERLGVKPTRGMLTESPYVRGMESSLGQQPTKAGVSVGKRLRSVEDGLEEASSRVLSEGKIAPTAIEAGEDAKKTIVGKIGERLDPAIDVYQKLEDSIPIIEIDPKSAKRVGRNILNLKYAKVPGFESSDLAKKINDSLGGVKTLEDLRTLKSLVGTMSRDLNKSSNLRFTAGQISEKLGRMEQSAITRGAIKAAREMGSNKTLGKNIAKEMIGEIKYANKIYREVSGDLKSLAKKAGLGKVRNYSDFMRAVEEMPSEKVMQKFFNPKNINLLNTMKKEFPDAFNSLRRAKMGEMYTKSLTPKGDLSFRKLLMNAKRLSPEVKNTIFGKDGSQAIDDIQKVYNSFYDKIGPSGTPEGLAFQDANPLKPSTWFKEFFDKMKKDMLDNPERYSRKIRENFFKKYAKEGLMSRPDEAVGRASREKLSESLIPRGLIEGGQNISEEYDVE